MTINDLKKELSKLSGVNFHNPKYSKVFKRYALSDDSPSETEEVETEETEEKTEEAGEKSEETAKETKETEKKAEELEDYEETEETEEATEEEQESEIEPEKETTEAVDLHGKLLETQLELELVRAGVRDDRLEVAKRLFLPDLKAGMSIEEVREKISEFPEWMNQGGNKGFGMPLGDKTTALTAEEKRLKQMGIDPRD